ncbi:transaldolase [Haloechinothrix alba]|uniref:Transaldolase n=1 Tax=Haloechinothrix alba TaxID=664784 RepID=A0A238Y3E6_9PSEU|nr:transaldolase [Haloechinothrix alba]SNR65735.1 transaldolase [Haloechinothrix alba]
MGEALRELASNGVAVWLDELSRRRLRSGNLEALVRSGQITGVTTNPTIFHRSLSEDVAYADELVDLAQLGFSADEVVRVLTTADVRWACDVLRGVHDVSDGRDGWVSIEVDPRLAHDTARTVAEARLLWWMVDRPNVLIKIPATAAGLPAVAACLGQGISVNVTLIFSVDRYQAVLVRFLEGLEAAYEAGRDVSRIGSVASFFVSRMDAEVDRRLDAAGTTEAAALRGQAAIANARLAYERFEHVCRSDRWRHLERAGARPQRPLWASTGVKDPAYDDTRYVTELVAPQTVNTMPEVTRRAVSDHGVIGGDRVRGSYDEARSVFRRLAAAGVDYDQVVRRLESEGVAAFQESWNGLLEDVDKTIARVR